MAQTIESRDYPVAAAAPILLALGLAPLVAGYQEVLPALALALLVWISLCLRLALPGRESFRVTATGWLAAAIPLFAAITFAFSGNPGATVTQALLLTTFTAAFWLATDLVRHGKVDWLLSAILFGALLAGGLALREYLERWRAGEPNWRTFGQFTNPNFLAGYLLPALLLTLTLALRRPEAFKPGTWFMALGLITATLGGALATTGSRGGLYSLVGGIVVFLLLLALRRSLVDRESLLRLGAILAVLALSAGALSAPLRQRQAGSATVSLPPELCPASDKTAVGESNQFRLLTWKATWEMGKRRPLTGYGAGAYEAAYAPHAIAGYTRQAHNSYLQLFAEGGAPLLLLWLVLLGAAGYSLLRQLRQPERFWIPGVGAALAASAVHNLFDSLIFVPAIALLTWVLLGKAAAPVTAPPVAEPVVPSRRGRRNATAASPDRSRFALVGAVLMLLLVTGQVIGNLYLQQGLAGLRPSTAREKLETLATARFFLPWDIRVARALSRAHANLGLDNLDEAIREAHRVVRLAPDRMPTYQWIASLYRAQDRPDLALQTLQAGLERTPSEAVLLYSRAQMEQELGLRMEAQHTYRKLIEVEQSPVGQVRALSEIIDWRFARAHMALAGGGSDEEAFQHRLAAACQLAQRRILFHGNPAAYLALEDLDAALERSLRADEEKLWLRLAEDFEARGKTRAAELAREQAEKVDETREELEKLILEVHGRL